MKPGLLFLIAACLTGSALFRVGAVGQAFAQTAPLAAEPVPAAPEPDYPTLLEQIRVEQLSLAERRDDLDNREQLVAAAEAEIEEMLARLTAAEEALAATLARASDAADRDVTRMVGVYSAMKPRDAGALFEEIGAERPDFVAGFLMAMDPEIAGAIMANLSPERAFAVSALMAGRHAGVPTE